MRESNKEYPEHEKLSKIQNQSQSIGEFLEWLKTEKNGFLQKR